MSDIELDFEKLKKQIASYTLALADVQQSLDEFSNVSWWDIPNELQDQIIDLQDEELVIPSWSSSGIGC